MFRQCADPFGTRSASKELLYLRRHDFHILRRFKAGCDIPVAVDQEFREVPLDIPVVLIILVHFLYDAAHHERHRPFSESLESGVRSQPAEQRDRVSPVHVNLGKLREYRRTEIHGNAYRRPEKYGILIPGEPGEEKIPLPGSIPKPEAETEHVFTVPYSFVDLNGHMNNTRYFDLAEDSIGEAAEGRTLKRIETEYINEARFGEKLVLRWQKREDAYLLSGESSRPVFRMKLSYDS